MATEEDLWQLVLSERQGVLATVARHGRPQLSNYGEQDADAVYPDLIAARRLACAFRSATCTA